MKLRLKRFDSVVSPSLLFGLAILPLQASCIGNLPETFMKRIEQAEGLGVIIEKLLLTPLSRSSHRAVWFCY